MRWFGIAVIWGFFAGCVLGFTSGTAIGPIVITLPGAAHGVHSGDLGGVVVGAVLALVTTQAVRREWASR